jgi:hypothetical protein
VAASLHTVVYPQWPSRPLISTPADRVQSLKTLHVLDLPRSILTVQIQNPHKPKIKNKKNKKNKSIKAYFQNGLQSEKLALV